MFTIIKHGKLNRKLLSASTCRDFIHLKRYSFDYEIFVHQLVLWKLPDELLSKINCSIQIDQRFSLSSTSSNKHKFPWTNCKLLKYLPIKCKQITVIHTTLGKGFFNWVQLVLKLKKKDSTCQIPREDLIKLLIDLFTTLKATLAVRIVVDKRYMYIIF